MAAVRAGQLTPMFFGSAMSNFGVQLFLETFISLASPPGGGPVLAACWVGVCDYCSAISNFGVQLFLETFIGLASP